MKFIEVENEVGIDKYLENRYYDNWYELKEIDEIYKKESKISVKKIGLNLGKDLIIKKNHETGKEP